MLLIIYGSVENLHDSKKKRKLPRSSVLQGKEDDDKENNQTNVSGTCINTILLLVIIVI
jgi:hypothetical protein